MFTDRISSIAVMMYPNGTMYARIQPIGGQSYFIDNISRRNVARLAKLCQDAYWAQKAIFQPALTTLGWKCYLRKEPLV